MLLALPARRALCVSVAGAVSVALFAPFALFGSSAFASGLRAAATPDSTIFQPWQLWWFFGHHGHVVHGLFGAVKPGYRTAPAWPATISHPLIVAAALPLTLGAWLRLRAPARGSGAQRETSTAAAQAQRSTREGSALLLLALLLLLRCMLDTWDIVYYPLPFVLALTAWETLTLRRVPVLALSSSAAMWVGCRWLPSFASADAQAAFFAAWSVPLAIGLGSRCTAVPGACACHAPRTSTPIRCPSPLAAPKAPSRSPGRSVQDSVQGSSSHPHCRCTPGQARPRHKAHARGCEAKPADLGAERSVTGDAPPLDEGG